MPKQSQQKQQATAVLGWTNQWNVSPDTGTLIPLISGVNLLQDMKRMFLTDDSAGAMIWTITSTLRQVIYAHIPQVDGEDAPDDEEARKWATFADSLLTDMRESYPIHASEIVNILWAGFVPYEIVLKQRTAKNSRYDDRYYGVDKVLYRDPLTVSGWQWNDAQEVVGMAQMGAREILPTWKLLIYSIGGMDGRPQGNPLLLSAWRSWKLKVKIQDSEAVGIDRDLCGLPVFRVPEELLTEAQEKGADSTFTEGALAAQQRIAAAIQAVKDMRFNRSGGLVLPSNTFNEDEPGDKTPKYDFSLVTTAGQRSIDTRTVIRDYDKSITRSLAMQFLHLGDRSTGSYALSDDQSSMAMRSLQALANIPAEEWTAKVLPLIWEINSFPKKYMPRNAAGRVSKENLASLGQYWRGVGAVLDLISEDPDARSQILDIGGVHGDRKAQRAASERAVKKATFEAVPKQPILPGLEPGPKAEPKP